MKTHFYGSSDRFLELIIVHVKKKKWPLPDCRIVPCTDRTSNLISETGLKQNGRSVMLPRGLLGLQWLWWRWCRRVCRSFWSPAWPVDRREDSHWRCSCRSPVSGKTRTRCRAGKHRWCALCCSGPAALEWPGYGKSRQSNLFSNRI